MAEAGSSRTGASIVYEPEEGEPIVDIVLVHGLQGHPFKTWTYVHKFEAETKTQNSEQVISDSQTRMTNGPLKVPWLGQLFQKLKDDKNQDNVKRNPKASTFWPQDLLPSNCPKARIIVLGYDTVVVKLPSGGKTNRNNIFMHSKDLLNELSRTRPLGRRVIFVAHSFGGILVKEMLSNCSTSNSHELQDILASTSAVIFLGTPHRGSSVASLGAVARKAASFFLLDTNPSIINSLALKDADLSRCQDVFSSLWAKHDFQVKTFQEALEFKFKFKGLPFVTVRAKVVPDYSSCIGDPRERAETLHGDHREICRFDSANCPNYKKVSGELEKIYIQLEAVDYAFEIPKLDYSSSARIERFLRFPGMQNRLKAINSPLLNTGGWLHRVQAYADWIAREKIEEHHGLLQIVGKPGSGKSTIMKRTFEQVLSKFHGTTTCVAGFFFNQRGSLLEHSSLGMFRSLLYQILRFHPQKFPALLKLQEQELQEYDEHQISELYLSNLRDMFQDLFLDQQSDTRTIIFVDALDECDEPGSREIAYFFRHLTDAAYSVGVRLDVCLSRRDFPNVLLRDCPEVRLEMFTRCDIEYYISRQLEIAGFGDNQTMQLIQREIADKADGIFLWVILVIEKTIKERDNGRNEKYLLREIRRLPAQLNELFTELLDPSKMSKSELRMTLRLYQWAVLSTSPLRLREWHHILAFIQDEPPTSLAEWKDSIYYTATDEQLVKQLRVISRGLVEVKTHHYDNPDNPSDVEDMRSAGAGAGSLDSSSGESRIVQPIHESVRAFFVEGGEWLSKALEIAGYTMNDIVSFCAQGHITLMKCCFQYLAIKELEELCDARFKTAKLVKFIETPELTMGAQLQSEWSAFTPELEQIPEPSMKTRPQSSSSSCVSKKDDHMFSFNSRFLYEHDYIKNWVMRIKSRFEKRGFRTRSPSEKDLDATLNYSLPYASSRSTLDEFHPSPSGIHFLEEDSSSSNDSLRSASFGSSASSHDINNVSRFQDDAKRNSADHIIDSDFSDFISEPKDFHSLSAKSKTLDEYLALESYAINRVFLHARLAQNAGANPMPIIRLLHGGCYWQRWLSLQENITTTTSLLSLAVEQGLNTWVDCIMGCDSLRPPVKKINAALFSAILRRQAQSIRIFVVHDAQLVGKKTLRKALSKKKVRQTFLAALEESHAGDKTNGTILSAIVPDYLSILYQALGTGDFELVQDFLNFDVSVKHKLCDGIHNFIKDKYCEKEHLSAALKLFADSGANINERNASGESLVHIAVKSLDADLLHALIDAGADVNATGPSNWTSLHYICHGYGREGFIQHLVRAGANINAKDIAGQTPLHCSVHKNWSTKLVEELIANGASVDIQDTDHRTPIDILLEELGREGPYYKAIYQINALMSAGAHFDVTHRDSCGRTLLYKAILSSDKELTELLVKRGADINEKDEEGRTALHIAVALATDNELISAFWKPPDKSRIVAHLWLRKNLCGVLLGLGADASAKTTNGLTVLHIAADAGIYRLIERLVALGAGLDECDHLGRTPLYLAAAQGYKYAVRALLKSGANARIQDQAGISPLRRASKGTHATSNSTARILCAHLQGDDLLSECSCEYGKLHVSDS